MKTKYFILSLFLSLYVAGTGVAQIELPESTKKGLEKYNKEQKEKEPKEEAEEKNDKTKEQEKAWEKMLEENMEEFKDAASYFNTKGLNCVFLTVLYLDGYLNLVELTNSEHNIQRRCDLLGTQAGAIAMSTMILYCPEYLAGFTMEQEDELVYVQLKSIRDSNDKPAILDQWLAKFDRVIKKLSNNDPFLNEYYSAKVIDHLTNNFRPESIISLTLEIAREMEAMGCDDY